MRMGRLLPVSDRTIAWSKEGDVINVPHLQISGVIETVDCAACLYKVRTADAIYIVMFEESMPQVRGNLEKNNG